MGEGLGRGWGLRKEALSRVPKILRGQHTEGRAQEGVRGVMGEVCVRGGA